MSLLTVFTPTYNRASLLPRAYEALKRQTCKDFVWLVIDDGSTDGTRELVQNWQSDEEEFEIRYVYKENGGLYSGYTTAFQHIDTELCVCVDSDDYLTDNAVEMMLDCWREKGSDKYAGLIGLDAKMDGTIIGGRFPPNLKSVNLVDTMLGKAPVKDVDWKNVVRTDLYRAVLPPKELTDTFSQEKDFNPHYLHIKICEEYDFLTLNEVLCIVNYQPDGMTATVIKQYLRSPNSFRAMRLLSLTFKKAPLKYRVKTAIHYTSSCIISKKPCISASPQKMLTALAYPFGLLLTAYIKLYCKNHT